MTSWMSAAFSIRRAASPSRPGKTGCGPIRPLLAQLAPELLGEDKVGGMAAVQVADLATLDAEGKLATPSGSRLHARPGGDLVDDLFACRLLCHVVSVLGQSVPSS